MISWQRFGLFGLAATLLALASCSKSPFESGLASLLAIEDPEFASITSISIVSETDTVETRSILSRRITEIQTRTEYHLREIANEPCYCLIDRAVKTFHIGDLEWMVKKVRLDTMLKARLLRKKFFYGPGEAERMCFNVLYRQKALLDSLDRAIAKNPDPYVMELQEMIDNRTSLGLFSVSYRLTNNAIRTKSIFVKASELDTTYVSVNSSMDQVFRPGTPAYPKLDSIDADLPETSSYVTWCGRVDNFFIGEARKDHIEWADSTEVYELEKPVADESRIYARFDCYVDTTQGFSYRNGKAHALFLFNKTDEVIMLDRDLVVFLEARDRGGNWNRIQSCLDKRFERPLTRILQPNQFAVTPLCHTTGDYETDFRVAVLQYHSLSYSRSFRGYASDSLFMFPEAPLDYSFHAFHRFVNWHEGVLARFEY